MVTAIAGSVFPVLSGAGESVFDRGPARASGDLADGRPEQARRGNGTGRPRSIDPRLRYQGC